MRKIRELIFEKGFLLVLGLSVFCLCFFFGKLLVHPNVIYFGSDGDGLQAYYNAIYHVRFDTSYWHFTGQNYPYGEHVFFTGCQPFVTNIIKFISQFIDISGFTVGIINLIMLLSIVLSAIVLYFIFKHLRLPAFFSAIAATAIAFMSPQIDRLGGHYSLTYQFAIPLFLLLILKFHAAPSLKKSWVLAFVSFFMAGTHLYFFGFYALISVVFWAGLFLLREKPFSNILFAAKHFFIQVVLPFLLLQSILWLTNSVTDRTTTPWGFLVYVSNPSGIFYPSGKPYEFIFRYFVSPEMGEWEGWAYIGFVAVLVILGIIIETLVFLIRRQWKQIPGVINNRTLALFLIAAIFGILLSFGLPFNIKGWEFLLNYASLLKQMRGIGRFAWIFFYVINIIACFKLYLWCSRLNGVFRYSLLGLALILMGLDSYTKTHGQQDYFDNRIPQNEDTANEMPENSWIKKIDPSRYQSIIPLPFSHIGSENIWIVPTESKIVKTTYLVSLKTGLSSTMTILSRTSLSETYKSVQPFLERYRPLEILQDLPNEKPFLVLANESILNENEKFLLSLCTKLFENPEYNVYQLDYNALKNFTQSLYMEKRQEMNSVRKFVSDGFQSNDSLHNFKIIGTETQGSDWPLRGPVAYMGKINEDNILFEGNLPFKQNEPYVLSFWVNDFTRDLYPRSSLEIKKIDEKGEEYHSDGTNLGRQMKIVEGNWALIEDTFRLSNPSDKIRIVLTNKELPDDAPLNVSGLLIRARSTNVYRTDSLSKNIWFNNRTYFANPAKE